MATSKKETGAKAVLGKIVRHQLFIPVAALLILAIFNLIADPSFYKITLGYSNDGNPIYHDDFGLWFRACDSGNWYDTCYSSFGWTGYLCRSNNRNRR